MKTGLFSDTHYCDKEILEQNRKPRRALECAKTAASEFKRNGVEKVICLCDMIHLDGGIAESVRHLQIISDVFRSEGFDCYICLGNHDNEVLSHEDYRRISGFKIAPCKIETERSRLLMLDASYTPDSKPSPEGELDWTVSFVPDDQLGWLDRELNTHKDCYIFIHQNIDTNVEERHIVSNADEINSVIAAHKNVAHVYQGHYHYGARSIINSVPYTTLRAMCIGEENNYMIIDV